MKLISQGAEAKIYLADSKYPKEKDTGDKIIIKDRIKKDYRIEEIDNQLRGFRTRREAKILHKLHKYGFVPKVLENDEKERLAMEYIEGPKIRDVLEEMYFKDMNAKDKNASKDMKENKALKICREIAQKIKLMHDNNIIHGDLTTSNMILNENAKEGNKVFFIDFGLSFVSAKVDDKAVDLHLLKQALESKHYKIWKECVDEVLDEYGNDNCGCRGSIGNEEGRNVIKRLKIVEKRGKNKGS